MAGDSDERDHAALLARVDPGWDAARSERALAGLHRRRSRRRVVTVLGATVLVMSGASFAWRASLPDESTPRRADGEPRAPAPQPRATTDAPDDDRDVRLADGSRVVPDEGAEVVVEHVTDTLIAVSVERGAAFVDVVPGLPRRFEVRVGAVTVTVRGTAFRVERVGEERARVSVERGHVEVSWAGGQTDLFAEGEGVFPPAAELAALGAHERADLESPSEAASTERGPPRTAAPTGAGAERTEWRALARASRYDEAYEAMGEPAERERAVADAVEDLLLAADVARLSGHPAEALPWLERVEREHGADPRAAVAAFTRGRILMELGRHGEAARQLERVLAMEPGGSLAEDALARTALAHAAAGEATTAVALARRYLDRHPDGRWSRRIREIVGRDEATLP